MSSTRSSEVGRNLAWRCNGADWILLHKRRRMGRVVPDGQRRGMYRVALPSGRLSDFANLPRAKDSALAAATRELEFEDRQRRANDPQKSQQNGGVSRPKSSPVRQNGSAARGERNALSTHSRAAS
jgi:hypothetical protein